MKKLFRLLLCFIAHFCGRDCWIRAAAFGSDNGQNKLLAHKGGVAESLHTLR